MTDVNPSTVFFGARTQKTKTNPTGWYAFEPNVDKPCVLVLGGDGVSYDKAASGMAKRIEEMLRVHGCDDAVDVCAVVYQFNSLSTKTARQTLLGEHGMGHSVDATTPKLMAEIQNPQYVDDIYNKFFKNRILASDGTKLPADEVARRMRNVTVCAHCHGSYTYVKLEEKLQASLKSLGYSVDEQNKILKNLVCAAYAPYAPLGKSKTTMVSFANARDGVVHLNNRFQRAVQSLNDEGKLKFGYYPNESGNVFIAPDYKFTPDGSVEINPHDWVWGDGDYLTADKVSGLKIKPGSNWILNKNGQKVYSTVSTMMGNTLANSVLLAMKGEPLLDTGRLVSEWRYLENGQVLVHQEATNALQSVYDTASKVGEKQLDAIKKKVRSEGKGYHQHRADVKKVSDLERANPDTFKKIKKQKALQEVVEIDGRFFVPEGSLAVAEFKNKGIELIFDKSKQGYFVPEAQMQAAEKIKRQSQLLLNDEFCFCFEKRVVGNKVEYITPDNFPISAQKADELINYFRSAQIGPKQNRVDLIYDDKNKSLRVAPQHVENYENFMAIQSNKLSALEQIQFTPEGEFRIPIQSADELTQTQKGLKLFGVETRVQGNNLIVEDMNVLVNNPVLKDRLPHQYRKYVQKGYDFKSSRLKKTIEVETYFEKILPKTVVFKDYNKDISLEFDFDAKKNIMNELKKRAPNIDFVHDGWGSVLVKDTLETRAFLAANLDETGNGVVPLDVAKKRMQTFKPVLEKLPPRVTTLLPDAKAASSALSKATKVGSKIVKVAGGVAVVADVVGAVVDPEGTAEFHDDLFHGRFSKIGEDMQQAVDAVSSQPISETVSQISDVIGEAVSEHYEGANTAGDYIQKTLQAGKTGFLNGVDVVGTGFGSAFDGLYSVVNEGFEAVGVDERAVSNSVSVDEFRTDPLEYMKTRMVPATVDAKTGIRSDDSYFKIIDRNDLTVLKNYINKHPGQWTGLIQSHQSITSRVVHTDDTGKPTGQVTETETVQSPVVYAAFEGKREAVSLLLTDLRMHDYVFDADKYTGQTALIRLIDRMPQSYFKKEVVQQKKVIKELLSHPSANPENINKVDKTGHSAFLYAAKLGDTDILVALSQKKVNVNQTNNKGENALHLYQGNDPVMISALINAGVDKNQRDQNGRTPFEKHLYDCSLNPSQAAYLRVSSFIECATKEELQELCLNPDMANRLKFVSGSNMKVAIELRKKYPEFFDQMSVANQNESEEDGKNGAVSADQKVNSNGTLCENSTDISNAKNGKNLDMPQCLTR